ncbi:MAG: D-tyrosyl-tRNA(Tyr) deacylase [Acidobacteria bacterium]|nr:D-tyrosyl-tRNA(Tyr) deacylase [Acidobacteriota bacterium]MYJ05158.1 D-tyrosyl-tRNA(Tyr) deacylase [Acidobacteriota bacterium]
MRAVVQRVRRAVVTVEERVAGRIGPGLVVLLGVGRTDSGRDADWMADKVASLRIFADAAGQMNRSVAEAEGALLVVSQFTLFGDCRRGRRPSYVAAAEPEQARRLYLAVVDRLRRAGYTVETGEFGAMMDVELVNDGPVTLLIDSERTF